MALEREPRDATVVADDTTSTLIRAAGTGDQRAWERLVDRYANLVWSVARSFRLGEADAADVAQATWLRLVQHLCVIRDPERLGAWLATTARREALALLRRRGRDVLVGDVHELSRRDERPPSPDDRLLRVEQSVELRTAFAALPSRCRQLLRVLLADPPPTYEEAAAAMRMPVGSVGPTRARCLEHLRDVLRMRRPSEE
jgi:RNA polymerase sigma factor (sigma-70 family)